MNSEQIAPLSLSAMTLRGIGSYIGGARLEIKPLTVLCGPNGSGKSTWLKTLGMLQRSLAGGFLPWQYDIIDCDVANIRITNAFYHLSTPDDFSKLSDPRADEQFGPPATIGLEIVANRGFSFGAFETAATRPKVSDGVIDQFFWNGQVAPGTRFCIRIAHPTYWASDDPPTPELTHLIELTLDGNCLIRIEGEREEGSAIDRETGRPHRKKVMQISAAEQLLSTLQPRQGDLKHLGEIVNLRTLSCESRDTQLASESLITQTATCFELRIRQLLKEALDGFFYVEAIRPPYRRLFIEQTDAPASDSRHVGNAGELAWPVQRRWHAEMMRESTNMDFAQEDVTLNAAKKLSTPKLRQNDKRLNWLCQCCDTILRTELERAMESPNSVINDGDEKSPIFGDYSKPQLLNLVAKILNGLLKSPNLPKSDVWISGATRCSDLEIQELLSRMPDISPGQLRRLNFLLIHEVLSSDNASNSDLKTMHSYSFEDYVSTWMEFLTQARLSLATNLRQRVLDPNDASLAVPAARVPTGCLVSPSQLPPLKVDCEKASLHRISHPCFGYGELEDSAQPPAQFSAGFHQIFPVIVQLGLMRYGELLGIENPEVHLHPALQLRFTESLIAHVSSGRRIILETHSDLVIRRILRAVLQEDLQQSNVQVYFTDLKQVEVGTLYGIYQLEHFHGSVLTPIKVDERGRISNWPNGFLDDDVRESQRLMDIMYGDRHREEDNEE